MPLSAVALILDMYVPASVSLGWVRALVVEPVVPSRSRDHLVTGFLPPQHFFLLLSILYHSSLDSSLEESVAPNFGSNVLT